MQVQVIANCQARPISTLLSKKAKGIETQDPIILHLSKPEDRDAHLAQIEKADVVFAQLTSDAFQPQHLSSKELKKSFGEKVIIWPNIFYAGQQPYLRYFTHPQLGRLMGPLEALHDIRLYKSWTESGSVNPDVLDDYDADFLSAVRATSLAELTEKEEKCDVMISDFIAEYEDKAKLFLTFNHPSNLVLSKMAERLLEHFGHSDLVAHDENSGELLGRYLVPSVWGNSETGYQGDGFTIDVEQNVQRVAGPAHSYSRTELCAAFQKVYDLNEIYRTLEKVRMTPNNSIDRSYI